MRQAKIGVRWTSYKCSLEKRGRKIGNYYIMEYWSKYKHVRVYYTRKEENTVSPQGSRSLTTEYTKLLGGLGL